MAITKNFKDIISMPMWRLDAQSIAANGHGTGIFGDIRNNKYRHPYLFLLHSSTSWSIFDPTTGACLPKGTPALSGTFGAGVRAVFHSSQGPRGVLGTGNTASVLKISTSLGAIVASNSLANRGAGLGYVIRVIDNAAGGSGKTEERRVIANTESATPTVWLDEPLSFTPVDGATYEFLSGRLFIIGGGTVAVGSWKYYDVLTDTFGGNLSITGAPASNWADSILHCFSEQFTPHNRKPGEGFLEGTATYNGGAFNCIQATATTATTITGSGLPADLQVAEYNNFQVRIVEDTITPTSVGQRRRIGGQTGGANAEFTVAAWTVQPSSSAKFVVEGNDDRIMFRGSVTTVHCYHISSNTWDTTTFAAAPVASSNGNMAVQATGISRDPSNNARHSHMFHFRGGGVATLDIYDVAANTWLGNINYRNAGTTFTSGSSGAYAPATEDGRFFHINVNGTTTFARFDVRNRILDPSTNLRYTQGGANQGVKMAVALALDDTSEDKMTFVYHWGHTQTNIFAMAVQG